MAPRGPVERQKGKKGEGVLVAGVVSGFYAKKIGSELSEAIAKERERRRGEGWLAGNQKKTAWAHSHLRGGVRPREVTYSFAS